MIEAIVSGLQQCMFSLLGLCGFFNFSKQVQQVFSSMRCSSLDLEWIISGPICRLPFCVLFPPLPTHNILCKKRRKKRRKKYRTVVIDKIYRISFISSETWNSKQISIAVSAEFTSVREANLRVGFWYNFFEMDGLCELTARMHHRKVGKF